MFVEVCGIGKEDCIKGGMDVREDGRVVVEVVAWSWSDGRVGGWVGTEANCRFSDEGSVNVGA